MGKRIIPQRRGHGGPKYRSPSHRHPGQARYPPKYEGKGTVEELKHASGRSAPLAKVRLSNDKAVLLIAGEGMYEGQEIDINQGNEIHTGNVLKLKDIPEGTIIYNIESRPGDGGKFARTGGTFGVVVSRGKYVVVQMPSKQFKHFLPECLATVGKVAGGGQKEQPYLKAGKKYHSLRSKAGRHLRVRGVAMNAVSHPHGGGGHQHVGRPSTVGRNTPPGRKVGRLSPKKKKKKKKKR